MFALAGGNGDPQGIADPPPSGEVGGIDPIRLDEFAHRLATPASASRNARDRAILDLARWDVEETRPAALGRMSGRGKIAAPVAAAWTPSFRPAHLDRFADELRHDAIEGAIDEVDIAFGEFETESLDGEGQSREADLSSTRIGA
jgi:hypothetical protein